MSRQVVLLALLVLLAGGGAAAFLTGALDWEGLPEPQPYTVPKELAIKYFKDDAPANAPANAGVLPTTLVDSDGRTVDLTRYRGKQNLVLTITRGIPSTYGGAPCPYCIAQAHSYTGNYKEFQARDAEVLMLFPGPADKLGDFIEQSAGQKAFPFPLLLDKNLAVCDRLGIRGDLAKPSTYIVDKAGAVVYAYVGESLTDRPSLKAVLAQLDKLRPASARPAVPPPPTRLAPGTGR